MVILIAALGVSTLFNYIYSNKIDKLNATITINNMNSEFALQTAKKDVQKVIEYKTIVTKHYIPQTLYVDKFVKDENETDCHAANRLTNSFVF
jgi:hypothetical protein